MDKKVIFPEDYRYDSDLVIFKKAVDCTRELLADRQLLITYDFLQTNDWKILLTKYEFQQKFPEISWREYNEILGSEILYIIEENFNEELEIEGQLIRYLRDAKLSEEDISYICELKLEKRRYVQQELFSVQDYSRYLLKKNTVSDKLSGIRYDVSRSIDVNGEGVRYANIKLKTKPSLDEHVVPKQLQALMNQDRGKEISFICDWYDMEYLISELKRIQRLLEE